ncbi:S-type pyocin domain-containing protein [Photobacterium halotolerans]|uniref:S-type pyocin domain-containing protein n=1 Tax=Photobacterium halotolerans TaxID=265726 RepID=UPI0004006325|nr:S-type pyocin domain-containing protein [Photobacterium halotolerans]
MSVDDDSVNRKFPNAAFKPLDECIILRPPPPVREDPAPVAQFEYSFDLSCSLSSLRKHGNCEFFLGKTREESRRMNWEEKPVEHGFRFTTSVMANETKRLYAACICETLGVSEGKPVTVHPKGTDKALEAFMAVIPAVEIDGRLGHPSQGYFYHFCNGRLMQEYQILGEKRWAFRATYTTHERILDDYYQGNLSAILLQWKRNGALVNDQYLVYRRERITRLHLEHLSEDWLLQNGVKIDLNALQDAIQQPVLARAAEESDDDQRPRLKTHTVQRDPATGERETWTDIAAQYGLNTRELLNLNLSYEADSLSLDVGHQLIVQSSDVSDVPKAIRELPPKPPQAFNQALNSHYRYDGQCIEDTTIHPIRKNYLVRDIPVVRIKTVVTPVFAKSCHTPAGSNDAGTVSEHLDNFGPWMLFGIAPAEASFVVPAPSPLPPVNDGGVSNAATRNFNQEAATQLTKLASSARNEDKDDFWDRFRPVSPALEALLVLKQIDWHQDDTQYTEVELQNDLESVQSRIRIKLTPPDSGEYYPKVRAYHVDETRIPVRYLNLDKDGKSYSVALEEHGPHITWKPIENAPPEWRLTPGHDDGYVVSDILTTPIPSDIETPTVEIFPGIEDFHWSDVVLVFPIDSGIPPIYLVYSKKTRLPRNNGRWVEGEPGDGLWKSDHPRVNKITNGEPIPFKNGRPDFSKWSLGELDFDSGVLDGSRQDFRLVYEVIARQRNLRSKIAAKKLLKKNRVTPHHETVTQIQLIPSDLHNKIPHIGSASDLREMNQDSEINND